MRKASAQGSSWPRSKHYSWSAVQFLSILLLCVNNLQISWAISYQNGAPTSPSLLPGNRNTSHDRRFRRRELQSTHPLTRGPWTSLRAGSAVASPAVMASPSYYSRIALAGGLAGATGTVVLYPMDSAKTLRQSNPAEFSSVRQALWHLIKKRPSGWRVGHAYRGWLPAAAGAIPSSALYFGTYESCKRILEDKFDVIDSKWWIHGLAAACGNTLSSAVFVPKEVLKQQVQYSSSSLGFPKVLLNIVREKGIGGLYVGYQATLMRNIPSAMVRFMLYEELKNMWSNSDDNASVSGSTRISRLKEIVPAPVGLFAAGAVAGAVASGVMTPVDVVKTRLATGTCPLGVQNCFRHVVKETGWQGLYAGAGSRMMWSGAFSAIGFGTFEVVKGALGVAKGSAVVD